MTFRFYPFLKQPCLPLGGLQKSQGEVEVENLRVALLKQGVVLVVRSSEQYEVALATGESLVRGLYAYLAVPALRRSSSAYENSSPVICRVWQRGPLKEGNYDRCFRRGECL